MAVKKTTKVEQPPRILTHGIDPNRFPPPAGVPPQNWFDQIAFAKRRTIDQGAEPRGVIFRRLANNVMPTWFEWHSWTDRVVDTLCDNRWVGFSGCSSSCKTRNVAGFACVWWLADAAESSVLFCSTTVKALRKRGWAEVAKFATSLHPPIGNLVDSRMLWQARKGDDKHAIAGIAVEEGALTKVADNIKGWHTRRQMVVIDEATAVPQAIFEACTNLFPGCEEFILVLIGNPRSRLDEFGKFCEPIGGWNTVNVDDDEWETRPQMDGKPGIVIRFDAEKSPNIIEGRCVSKYLPSKERVEARRKASGSENDPSYWSNERGFWAPEGLSKTLFSETALIKHDGRGKHEFSGNRFSILGALDPARTGGDRAVVRFAAIGETASGSWGIEVGPPKVIPLNAKSQNPIDFQLAEQIIRECDKVTWRGLPGYSCSPDHFAVDATGSGADLCDIINRLWSHDIHRVQFGGRASDDPCSLEDMRPASEVYRNKRTEMYYRARNALLANQLKGLDVETCRELVTIEFDDSKALLQLMAKSDYKARFGASPDFADTIAILLELARRLGFRLAPVGQTINRDMQWDLQCQKCDSVYEDIDYSLENESDLIDLDA